ncbi:hypothetical protein Pcinc_035614 [Petrolisthes cinctipes]|uniref:Chitin-binding type-2 domain-containing protein n=1 Tax=Petrolisthes cinctipes TaxID=88211 RepID=A0AAE1BW78_PETCI|nr:hypothetical protein Pcinc_035614 [Petrolisthes cinctipes]
MGRSQAQNGNGYSYNGASPSNGYGSPDGNGYSYNGAVPSNGYGSPDVLRGDASVLNRVESLTNNIPGGGVPGEDYPILASIPNTGFTCQDQEFPGYFADTADEAGCQVFHICQFDGRQDSFLCPNGTIFNQQYFVCDWWYNVDCQASQQYRSLNADIGKVMLQQEETLRNNDVYSAPPTQTYNAPQSRQVAPTQTYNAPQERQSLPTPSQSYNAPQSRQASPSPSPSYTAPQSRQVAPIQTYNAPQSRQAPPTPSPSYTAPQSRQAPITPAPTQTYTAPQERQTPSPINTYSPPKERQVPSPSPSQFYESPNRF